MSTDNVSMDGSVQLETTLPHSQCSGSGSILHPATTGSGDGNQEQNTTNKRLDSPDVGVVSQLTKQPLLLIVISVYRRILGTRLCRFSKK